MKIENLSAGQKSILNRFTEGVTANDAVRLKGSYKPGMGKRLFELAPKSFQLDIIDQLKSEGSNVKNLSGRDFDKLLFKRQINLIAEISEKLKTENLLQQESIQKATVIDQVQLNAQQQTEARNLQEQLDREKRMVKAFMNMEVKPPVLSQENQLFASIDGSNVQEHMKAVGELQNKTSALQAEIASGPRIESMTPASRDNLVNKIQSVIGQEGKLKKQEEHLKPDQKSIDNAFVKATDTENKTLLRSLEGLGFKPSESIKPRLTENLSRGVMGKETATIGERLGLGERLVKAIADSARYLFTAPEKYKALTNPTIVNSSTIAETKKGGVPLSKEGGVVEEKGVSPIKNGGVDKGTAKEQMDKIANRFKLKIDWKLSLDSPHGLDKKLERTKQQGMS